MSGYRGTADDWGTPINEAEPMTEGELRVMAKASEYHRATLAAAVAAEREACAQVADEVEWNQPRSCLAHRRTHPRPRRLHYRPRATSMSLLEMILLGAAGAFGGYWHGRRVEQKEWTNLLTDPSGARVIFLSPAKPEPCQHAHQTIYRDGQLDCDDCGETLTAASEPAGERGV